MREERGEIQWLPAYFISRKVDSQERTERKKAVQEMNEGELLTALREKLKNIEAPGETFTMHPRFLLLKAQHLLSRIF